MTTQARELAKLVTNAGDVNLGDDISLASDGAILNFGADSDVTLTHVADTGLLLNSSRQIQFGDSGTYIRQSADAVLQLTSDTEVEINATTVDINANVDISGNLVLGGNITIGDADSDDISFGGELTSHIIPNADDTYDLGSSTKQWRNLYVDGSAFIDTIDGTDETTITNTDTGSSAGPIVSLYRNSSSAADADYLGQFKFQGENDNDQQVNYAKITGKILDASDGSEDGILEFAHIKAGSQTITGRWRSDSLQLLNGTTLVADSGVQIDNITIDGTEIDLSSGDLTLDVAGNIILDADGGNIRIYDGGTHIGNLSNSSSNLYITSAVQDKDIHFRGQDASSEIDALVLDMSAAGEATFNDDINLGDGKRLRMGAGGDFEIFHDGSHNYIKGASSDQDIIFQGVDGGSAVTALTLNMSDAGSATFNNHVYLPDNGYLVLGAGEDLKINSDGTNGIINAAQGYLNVQTGGSERMRIHANGKAAWSANGIGSAGTVNRDFAFYTEGGTNGVEIRSNDHRLVMLGAGGSSGGGVDDGYVAIAAGDSTTKIAFNANGDSYFTGGDLGIGTTSIDAPIHTDVGAPSSSDKTLAIFQAEAARQAGFGWDDSESAMTVGSVTNHPTIIKTHIGSNGGTSRAVFNTTTNTSYTPDGLFGGPATPHVIGTTGSGNLLLGYKDHGSGLYSAAIGLAYDAIDGLSNTAYVDGFVMRDTGNATTHLVIETDGDVKNTNNSYGSYSDERIKSDIADASSQWNDIKALKIRKYKLATQPAPYKDQFQIGVIAQELEAAGMNGLIKESDPDTKHLEYDSSLVGQKVKSVKYSVLHMKALKALQEAMIKIETLETKVAALESE